MQTQNHKHSIIIFDDFCLLCNKTVKFIIKHDDHKRFYFTPLHSPLAQELRTRHKLTELKSDTVILCHEKEYYLKSHAFIKIFSSFGGLWKLVSILKIIPTFILDWFYDFIAQHRYHLFGRSSTCLLPSKEIEDRFIDEASKLQELQAS